MAKSEAKVAPTPKDGEKVVTAKELATKLGVDAKRLRRWLRTQYGTHHERWQITPEMVRAATKEFKPKSR